MACVKKIGQYEIKDEMSRNQLVTLTENFNVVSSDVDSIKNTIPELNNKMNANKTVINNLTSRMENLESKKHLKMSYDPETETLYFLDNIGVSDGTVDLDDPNNYTKVEF